MKIHLGCLLLYNSPGVHACDFMLFCFLCAKGHEILIMWEKCVVAQINIDRKGKLLIKIIKCLTGKAELETSFAPILSENIDSHIFHVIKKSCDLASSCDAQFYCTIVLVLYWFISLQSKSFPFPLPDTLVIQTNHKSIFVGCAFCLEHSRLSVRFSIMEAMVIRHSAEQIRDLEFYVTGRIYAVVASVRTFNLFFYSSSD